MILVHLYLGFILIIYSISCEEIKCDDVNSQDASEGHCHVQKNVENSHLNQKKSQGVLVVRGRLGNHLWGYLEALALNDAFPLDILVSEETVTTLTTYFKNVRLPSVESSTCGWARYHQDHLDYIDNMVLDWLEIKLGQRIELERGADGRLQLPAELSHMYPPSTSTLIRQKTDFASGFAALTHEKLKSDPNYKCPYVWEMYTEPVENLIKPEWSLSGKHMHLFPGGADGNLTKLYRRPGVMETFLEDMTFKDEFIDGAEGVLRRIKESHLEKLKKKKVKKKKLKRDFLLIGIHCRRTDYIAYQERMGKITLKPQYYLDAMHLFRAKFGKTNNVVFVFISDDMEWGKERLTHRIKEGDLYFAGDGNSDSTSSIGTDLATLSLCNHTILSHGSYSYFAGVFAGGIKIVPEQFAEYRTKAMDYKELRLDPIEHPLPRFHFQDEMTPINAQS